MERKFETVDWAHSTNIYEVNTRQYTAEGTFRAFARELPRLREMGIETLWFMPVTPISVMNRKGTLGSYYACSDYRSINPEFGTLHDFREMIDEAKKQGFKILIDWVANHTGWDHVWTKTNPEFFVKNERGDFRPPFPEWSDTIQLDYSHLRMREAMIECMKYWVNECDIDGFRCDMAHLVPLEFWKQARMELDAVKPLFWFAETEDHLYHEVFDATYAWEFLHTMESYYRRTAGMNDLDGVLHRYNDRFPSTALRAFFTSNHDENSHSGSEYERMGEAAMAFAVLCATWSNAVPLIYSGQELPMKNKRLEFFEKDCIPWTGEYGLQEFYRQLLWLRKINPALRAGDHSVKTFRLDTSANQAIYAFLRKNGSSEVMVLLNLSDTELAFTVNGKFVKGKYQSLFTGSIDELTDQTIFSIKSWGYLVYYK